MNSKTPAPSWKLYAGVFLNRLEKLDMEPIYKMNLTQWAVFRCLPPSTNLCIKRFRRRQDAEAYVGILRGLTPEGVFQVVFDQHQESIDQG